MENKEICNLTSGKLFDMVSNQMKDFIKKEEIICLSLRSNKKDKKWGLLKTKYGTSFLIDWSEIKSCKLKILINNINGK